MEDVDELVVADDGAVRVFLLGTAHVSERSAATAEEAVNLLKPQYIMLELCQERASLLLQARDSAAGVDNPAPVSNTELLRRAVSGVQRGDMASAINNLLNILYAKASADMGNVKPGQEFIKAFQAGERIGSMIVLGDRRMSITLKRLWYSMTLFDKIKLSASFLYSMLFVKLDSDMLHSMMEADSLEVLLHELKQFLPSVETVLVTERDFLLTASLKRICDVARHQNPSKQSTVLAIVGKAHAAGIKQLWQKYPLFRDVPSQLLLEYQQPRILHKRTNWTQSDVAIGLGVALSLGLSAFFLMRKTNALRFLASIS